MPYSTGYNNSDIHSLKSVYNDVLAGNWPDELEAPPIYDVDVAGLSSVGGTQTSTTIFHNYVGNILSFTFADSGNYLVTAENSGSEDITRFSLSTPYDIPSGTTTGAQIKTDLSLLSVASPRGIHISPDGTKIAIAQNYDDRIELYEMTTPFDLSTIVDVNTNFISTIGIAPSVIELTMNITGNHVYAADAQNDLLYIWELNTPYDLTTATLVNSFDHQTAAGNTFTTYGYARGIAIDPRQRYMYLTFSESTNYTSSDVRIYKYSFNQEADPSGGFTYEGRSDTIYTILSGTMVGSSDIWGLEFGSNGETFAISGNSSGRFYQFNTGL